MHHVDLKLFRGRCLELVGLGEPIGERAGPERLEIDRVGEDEDGPRIDVVGLEQVLDFPFGLFFDPVVDVLVAPARATGGSRPERSHRRSCFRSAFEMSGRIGSPDCVQSALAVRARASRRAAFGPGRSRSGCAERRSGGETRGEAVCGQTEMQGLRDLRGRLAAGACVGHRQSA